MNTYRAEIVQTQGGEGGACALYIKVKSKNDAIEYFGQLLLSKNERVIIEEVPWAGY